MKIKKVELNSQQKKSVLLNDWVKTSINAKKTIEQQPKENSNKGYFELQTSLDFKILKQIKHKNK